MVGVHCSLMNYPNFTFVSKVLYNFIMQWMIYTERMVCHLIQYDNNAITASLSLGKIIPVSFSVVANWRD